MDNFKTEIHDDAVIAAFNHLIQLGEDPEPALDAIGRILKANIQLGFVASRSPYGQPWEPLKTRKGKPLVDSGMMRDSIDYQVSGHSVVVGTNKVQAPIQNFGGTITAKGGALFFMVGERKVFVHSVTIPPRQFMPTDGLPEDWRADVLDELSGILRDTITGKTA